MDLPSANRHLVSGEDLSREQMQAVMRLIMNGDATPAQIGAFLTALTIKGETVEEIVGAASIMRELSAKVETTAENIVDTVGTGGGWRETFQRLDRQCASGRCCWSQYGETRKPGGHGKLRQRRCT